MAIPIITKDHFFEILGRENRPWQKDYLAMYSSQWQGIATDPDLMLIPIDDHVVHRGDGVFDVMRCVDGRIYQMGAHLERLERSAKAISLSLPPDYGRVEEIIKQTVKCGGEKDCLLRIMLSRGPGSFGPSPSDCPSSQMYVTVIRYKALAASSYTEGIPIITSRVPIKKAFFANIKSCDYLPNVLMVKEAVEADCRYCVSLDEMGFLAEGPTENVGVVNQEGILKFPGFERTLAGTTLKRVFDLAKELVKSKVIPSVCFDGISREEAYSSREMFLTGTSINILPVISYDGHPIGEGAPGPVYQELAALLLRDMKENRDLLTDIPW